MAVWRQNGSLQTLEVGFATKLSWCGAILSLTRSLFFTEFLCVDGEGGKTASNIHLNRTSDQLHFMALQRNLLIYLSSDSFCKELITKVSHFQ